MSNKLDLILKSFENCEQARLEIEYCSVEKEYTVNLFLNDAIYASVDDSSLDTAIERLHSFVDEESISQDLPV